MGHTPFGYRIENGRAVVDEAAAGQIRQIFQFYLKGDSLTTAAIIDKETFDKAEQERVKRAAALGRIKKPEEQEKIPIPIMFHAKQPEQKFDDSFLQAEYAYSLIESEG